MGSQPLPLGARHREDPSPLSTRHGGLASRRGDLGSDHLPNLRPFFYSLLVRGEESLCEKLDDFLLQLFWQLDLGCAPGMEKDSQIVRTTKVSDRPFRPSLLRLGRSRFNDSAKVADETLWIIGLLCVEHPCVGDHIAALRTTIVTRRV